MGKTKQIGVRFDTEILEILGLSPQYTLNYLTDYWKEKELKKKKSKKK